MAATKKLEDMTDEEYLDHQVKEWSQYRANDRIYVHGVLAFNAGDPVPAGHVGRVEAPLDELGGRLGRSVAGTAHAHDATVDRDLEPSRLELSQRHPLRAGRVARLPFVRLAYVEEHRVPAAGACIRGVDFRNALSLPHAHEIASSAMFRSSL